jgi:IPT/TIG domain
MRRFKHFQRFLTGATIALGACALTGCDGTFTVQDAAATTIPAEAPSAAPALARGDLRQVAIGHKCETERKGDDLRVTRCQGDDQGPTVTLDAGWLATLHRADAPAELHVQTPASTDLEYTAGLPEPPQGQVVPAPAPWRPSEDAEANPKPVIDDVWPNKAPSSGGEQVMIRGKNLRTLQVVFGTVPAQIVSESQEAVTVAVPAGGAGEVAIVLTNRDGGYSVAAGAFSYYN